MSSLQVQTAEHLLAYCLYPLSHLSSHSLPPPSIHCEHLGLLLVFLCTLFSHLRPLHMLFLWFRLFFPWPATWLASSQPPGFSLHITSSEAHPVQPFRRLTPLLFFHHLLNFSFIALTDVCTRTSFLSLSPTKLWTPKGGHHVHFILHSPKYICTAPGTW